MSIKMAVTGLSFDPMARSSNRLKLYRSASISAISNQPAISIKMAVIGLSFDPLLIWSVPDAFNPHSPDDVLICATITPIQIKA
jgi:hypothetical protein